MTDKELVRKIKELRQIEPRKDWVLLTKKSILGEKKQGFSLIPRVNPVFAIPGAYFALLLAAGLLFSASQHTVPGDLLYSVQKLEEKAQLGFSTEAEKPRLYLEIANKRLEELNKIAEENRVNNIAPAVKEFQMSLSEAAKALDTTDPGITKEIVEETQKLRENKEKVESFGVVIGNTDELDMALALLVEREIEYLGERTLTEGQQELLGQIKAYFEEEDYDLALEKILQLSQ